MYKFNPTRIRGTSIKSLSWRIFTSYPCKISSWWKFVLSQRSLGSCGPCSSIHMSKHFAPFESAMLGFISLTFFRIASAKSLRPTATRHSYRQRIGLSSRGTPERGRWWYRQINITTIVSGSGCLHEVRLREKDDDTDTLISRHSYRRRIGLSSRNTPERERWGNTQITNRTLVQRTDWVVLAKTLEEEMMTLTNS